MNPTTIPNMSLYIPHVFPNFTGEYIASVFEALGIGSVDHVDLVSKLDNSGKPYNSAYIHFQYWYSGPIAENFQARVQDPSKEARIVHDDPWYWIILENTGKKKEPGARKECLDLSEPRVQFVEIAPGLSKVVLSPEMETELNGMITEFYNGPVDMSCEFDEYAEDEIDGLKDEIDGLKDEIARLQAENRDLREEVQHLNDQNIDVREQLDDEVHQLEYELFQMKLKFEDEQCNHGRTAQELEDTQHNLAMNDIEGRRFNKLCHSILHADTLEEAKEKICQELFKLSFEEYNSERNNA